MVDNFISWYYAHQEWLIFLILCPIPIASMVYGIKLIVIGVRENGNSNSTPIIYGNKDSTADKDLHRIQEIQTLERNHRIYKEDK